MSVDDLFERIAQLTPPLPGVSASPPPELVAFFVRWARSLRQLKKAALASMANVSLSTVERIERGEVVQPELLDKVGLALGYEEGCLTSPRLPIADSVVIEKLNDVSQHTVPVKVAPMRTQPQVRSLASCHGYLPFVPECDEEQRTLLHGLVEYFDFASFVIGNPFPSPNDEPLGRRKLYGDILEYVTSIKHQGYYILAGCMDAPRPNFPDFKIAIFSITSRAKDPGAAKRRTLLVDKRVLQQPLGLFPWET